MQRVASAHRFQARLPRTHSTTLHDTQEHTQQRDGGGLQPTAVNPDYWDLVPHSDIHQQLGSRDGVWRIRRHKHPHNAVANRSLHCKRKQLRKGLDWDQSDF